MNVIAWNVRGLGSNSDVNYVKDLIRRHHPDLLILIETMLSGNKLKTQALCINLNSFKHVDPRGLSEAILLIWNSTKVKVQILCTTEQEIHAHIKAFPSNVSRIISAISARFKLEERLVLWDNLKNTARTINLAWAVMGDFHEVLQNSGKKGVVL